MSGARPARLSVPVPVLAELDANGLGVTATL